MILRHLNVISVLSARMLLFSALLLTGTATEARDLMFQGVVGDQELLIFDDGFWRFSDSSGERCTKVTHVGELCALPSSWAPFPQPDPKALRPRFVRGSFEGFVTSLTPSVGPIEGQSVTSTLTALADFNNGAPTVLQKEKVQLSDFQGQQVVYVQGDRIVVFSIFDQNGRVLIFKTERSGFTLFHNDHQTAHEELINAVRLEVFDD
ncbi:MAG: hypothetical protein ABJ251_17315 [Paracoccaceae bacterium]